MRENSNEELISDIESTQLADPIVEEEPVEVLEDVTFIIPVNGTLSNSTNFNRTHVSSQVLSPDQPGFTMLIVIFALLGVVFAAALATRVWNRWRKAKVSEEDRRLVYLYTWN